MAKQRGLGKGLTALYKPEELRGVLLPSPAQLRALTALQAFIQGQKECTQRTADRTCEQGGKSSE